MVEKTVTLFEHGRRTAPVARRANQRAAGEEPLPRQSGRDLLVECSRLLTNQALREIHLYSSERGCALLVSVRVPACSPGGAKGSPRLAPAHTTGSSLTSDCPTYLD